MDLAKVKVLVFKYILPVRGPSQIANWLSAPRNVMIARPGLPVSQV